MASTGPAEHTMILLVPTAKAFTRVLKLALHELIVKNGRFKERSQVLREALAVASKGTVEIVQSYVTDIMSAFTVLLQAAMVPATCITTVVLEASILYTLPVTC